MPKKKIDTSLLSPVEIYKLVLSGKLNRFPQYYWEKPDSLQSAKEITIYLIEELLKWSVDDIKEKFSFKILIEYKLNGMIQMCFDRSPYAVINNAYPDLIKPWDLTNAPMNYWNSESGLYATKWLIEEILKWDFQDIKSKIDFQVFCDYGLKGMLQILYNSSPYEAINALYPNKFMPWELKQTPNKYWNSETGILATKWLIEDILKWNKNEIKSKLNFKTFCDYGLKGMLQIIYNSSPYDAINALYPNEFMPWELASSPQRYWNKQTAILATKWLIEDILKWNEEDIKTKLTLNTFHQNGLSGMMDVYKYSPYNAINAAYPNKFMPWELKNSPLNYWDKDTAIFATKWLIEKKLKWTEDTIKERLCQNTFREYGLYGMLCIIYKGSTFDAINAVYPNKFKKSDLVAYKSKY